MKRESIIECLEPLASIKKWSEISSNSDLVNAAVLVPLVKRDQWYVLLTQRSEHLNNHAGQVSFPGGKADKQDNTPTDTALRETEEEVGISEGLIEVVGVIEPYQTVTKFNVVPIVGFVDASYQVIKDEFEVAEVFEVPLAFVSCFSSYQQRTIFWKNEWRDYLELNYQGYRIWGATAAMLHNMANRLQAKASS